MLKQVTIQDLELLYHIETTCFPIQEAASYQYNRLLDDQYKKFQILHDKLLIFLLMNVIYQIVCTKMLFYIKKMENIK